MVEVVVGAGADVEVVVPVDVGAAVVLVEVLVGPVVEVLVVAGGVVLVPGVPGAEVVLGWPPVRGGCQGPCGPPGRPGAGRDSVRWVHRYATFVGGQTPAPEAAPAPSQIRPEPTTVSPATAAVATGLRRMIDRLGESFRT